MSGTMSAPGGIAPGVGAAGGNPQIAGLVQRYAQMPTEQLQELAARAGASPQGQIAGRVLQQRHVMPNAQPAQQQPAPQAASPGIAAGPSGTPIQQTQQASSAGISLPPTTNAMRHGGEVARQHFDMGGMSSSQETPFWARAEARGEDQGLIHAYSPGRTDTMNMEPLAGSYIIPADVISGIGEGNTLAGAAAMDRALSTGPHGIPEPRGEHGRGPPAPPRIEQQRSFAAGGAPAAGQGRVPIVVAGGEYVVSPEQVLALGKGDMKRGHDILDAFVLHVRNRTVQNLKKLPPPKKRAH
jgi:hypothetical protein